MGCTDELKTPSIEDRGVQLADPYRHTHRRQSVDRAQQARVMSNPPSSLADRIGPASFRTGH